MSTVKTLMKEGVVIKIYSFPGGVYLVERSKVGDPTPLDSCEMNARDMENTKAMYHASGYIEV